MRIRTSALKPLRKNLRIIIWASAALLSAVAPAIVAVSMCAAPAYAQRVFGLDTSSAANFDVSQTQWNNAYNSGWSAAGIPSFQFAIVRSSHGGTDGQSPASDDGDFYNNITRATIAGMLAGSYHYPHADVYTADDDAQHYLNHAGMYMKPGFLLPVLDLEGSSNALSQSALTTWALAFIDKIYQTKGINPIVYTSSSFNTDEVTPSVAWLNVDADTSTPHTGERTSQWLARPSGSITTGDPGAASGYPDPYGGWDPLYTTKSASTDPAVKPWAFWQNGSAHIDPSGASGYQFLIDFDAANGNIEFVRDFLIPALWTNSGSGDWGTIANWNSDNPDYVSGDNTTGPAPRLPAYDATNPTLGNRKYDWVKLQNSGGGTVTISSGAQAVRKFYTEQPLNITGGSLTVNYIPGSGGKWDVPSEFNDTVTLSSGAAYTAHTTQVDGGGGVFNINGGTVSFRDMQLSSHASNSGKIVMGGDVTFADFDGTGTAVIRSTGSLTQAGKLDLGNSVVTRTLTINNGSAAVDVSIQAEVTGAGVLVKSGPGTLQLAATNTYTGGTTVSSGILRITKDVNLGAVPGSAQLSNISPSGGTLQTGSELASLSMTNFGSGYTSFPTVSFGGAGSDAVAPTANVLGKISSILVTANGSGYTGTAKVVIVGGGGTGATATATMSGGGVSSITITNQGSGYTSVPTVYITDGSGQGVAGSGATANVNGITLTGITLNSKGFDYASPTVSLTGGGGSGATASVSSTTSLTLNTNRGIKLGSSNSTLYQTAGTTFTVGSVISSAGSGTLTKSGAGTLTLSGANTYTGDTALNGGVLQYTTTANLGSASNSIVFFGSTLRPLAGITEARNVTITADGGTLDIPVTSTFSGVVSGTGSLTKSGIGTLNLSNNNTYTGTTTVSAGTLQIGNGGATGSLASASIVNSSAVSFNRSTDSTYAGVVSGGGTLAKSGAGTLTLTGANTYTGATTISAGALQIGSGGTTGSLANQGGIVNNNSLIFNRSDAHSYGGAVSGSGSVTKLGAGTFTLAGSNSYAGNTIINSGVLQYSVSSNLGSASNSIVFGGGMLRTSAAGTQTRSVTLNAAGGTIDTSIQNPTFSGNFSGAGGLTKIGTGMLTLTGVNSYSGGTTVNAGTLAASGASTSFGGGNVTVTSGALRINSGVTNAIADTATLAIAGAAQADIESGVDEHIAALLLAGAAQLNGATYGSSSAVGAMFQDDTFFNGTGFVTVGLAGDYNGNNSVDAGDYLVWRKMFSSNPLMYDTWRANFGNSAPAGSSGVAAATGVPEPSSIGLFALALAALAARRPRR